MWVGQHQRRIKNLLSPSLPFLGKYSGGLPPVATEHLQGKAGSETDLRMDGFISWDTLLGITVKIHNQVPGARELEGDFSYWFRDKKNLKNP